MLVLCQRVAFGSWCSDVTRAVNDRYLREMISTITDTWYCISISSMEKVLLLILLLKHCGVRWEQNTKPPCRIKEPRPAYTGRCYDTHYCTISCQVRTVDPLRTCRRSRVASLSIRYPATSPSSQAVRTKARLGRDSNTSVWHWTYCNINDTTELRMVMLSVAEYGPTLMYHCLGRDNIQTLAKLLPAQR